MTLQSKNRNVWLWCIGLGILFPLFFQLDGGIYRDLNAIIDSHGVLTKLPLPVSILVCLAALVFLPSDKRRAGVAVAMIVGTVFVSLLSLWLAADGSTSPLRKLIVTLQILLPMVGLLLGQLVDDRDKVIARAFLVVLSVVVPWQLLATWMQGGLILTHYLYAFSIYSHFQYVTLILVCAFAYSLTSLWEEYRLWLCVMAVLMFVYVTASLSFLTIFAYLALAAAFGGRELWRYRTNSRGRIAALALIALIVLGAFAYFGKMDGQRASVEGEHGLFHGKFKSVLQGKIPLNVQERFGDWKLFGKGILETPQTILVGHPEPMPREIRASPHNWYMDTVYTFGLVALLPILSMIAYTGYLCWRQRKTLSTETWWLLAIVFYLVIIDSNFKVTLRQPYPGIFAYFLWGVLLSRLRPPAVSRHGA
ncbi:hypothetical protein ACEN8I_13765 [Polaromonas sp. CT11-55]|uniref:hypothetical protein n=1 Tax=Polaromonas sp. CT11-55 TaxID=3243045 RepID=UPI0039A5E58F